MGHDVFPGPATIAGQMNETVIRPYPEDVLIRRRRRNGEDRSKPAITCTSEVRFGAVPGMHKMGFGDVFDALRTITCDPRYRSKVEWLGSGWGHPVAPSTPVQDYRLHLRAWQHHFAALFGIEALQRVRGFSPAEMALPNHPDVAYEFVRALRECGDCISRRSRSRNDSRTSPISACSR